MTFFDTAGARVPPREGTGAAASVPAAGPAPRARGGASRSGRAAQVAALLADLAAAGGGAALGAALYHRLALGGAPEWALYAPAGLALGAGFVVAAGLRGHYDLRALALPLASAAGGLRLFAGVFAAFVGVLFMLKLTGPYSRGTLAAQAGIGALLLGLARFALARAVAARARDGRLLARRVVVLAPAGALDAAAARLRAGAHGLVVVRALALPGARGPGALAAAGRDAVAALRGVGADEVVLAVALREAGAMAPLIGALRALPAALHLMPLDEAPWLGAARPARVGEAATLRLARPPLGAVDRLLKRGLDLGLAALLLVALAPLFGLVALAVRLDSPGPALFRQRRHGFDRRPFVILKFRTMSVMEDGERVPQATADDPRVTRLGRLLRRTSLDELPQLLNVLRGEMSLVGPRPHALAHDREWEARLALYAHRHAIKPGVTGWAQVNGFRGETDAPWKMEARVAHDLHYVARWSLLLDLKILALTVLSPRVRRGAR